MQVLKVKDDYMQRLQLMLDDNSGLQLLVAAVLRPTSTHELCFTKMEQLDRLTEWIRDSRAYLIRSWITMVIGEGLTAKLISPTRKLPYTLYRPVLAYFLWMHCGIRKVDIAHAFKRTIPSVLIMIKNGELIAEHPEWYKEDVRQFYEKLMASDRTILKTDM